MNFAVAGSTRTDGTTGATASLGFSGTF